MKATFLLMVFLLAAPVAAQDCTNQTGNNASVILPVAYAAEYSVHGEACYGSYDHRGGNGESIAFAVWEDDPTTGEKDGASIGEPLALHIDGVPTVQLGNYVRDNVVIVATAPADSLYEILDGYVALNATLDSIAVAALDERDVEAAARQVAEQERDEARAAEAAAEAALEEEREQREVLIEAAVAEAVASRDEVLTGIAAEVRANRSIMARRIEALLERLNQPGQE